MLKEAFHEDAWMLFTEPDGALRRHLISESFAEWATSGEAASQPIKGRIISATQAGDDQYQPPMRRRRSSNTAPASPNFGPS
jgi:hypothetical protein